MRVDQAVPATRGLLNILLPVKIFLCFCPWESQHVLECSWFRLSHFKNCPTCLIAHDKPGKKNLPYPLITTQSQCVFCKTQNLGHHHHHHHHHPPKTKGCSWIKEETSNLREHWFVGFYSMEGRFQWLSLFSSINKRFPPLWGENFCHIHSWVLKVILYHSLHYVVLIFPGYIWSVSDQFAGYGRAGAS